MALVIVFPWSVLPIEFPVTVSTKEVVAAPLGVATNALSVPSEQQATKVDVLVAFAWLQTMILSPGINLTGLHNGWSPRLETPALQIGINAIGNPWRST